MGNLINAFLRYGGWFLFIFLEFLCFYLIVQNNEQQGEIYSNSRSFFVGSIFNKYNDVAQFWNLSAVADSLARENARLYEKLDNAKYINNLFRDTVVLEDVELQYNYLTARVINNSINNNNNYLTLNKGSKQGLKPLMGVYSPTGIVGITKSVSNHYAIVNSILNRQTRISASVKRNDYFGSLVWKGSNPKIVDLEDIPKHANLVIGDTIQTSGFSTMFPPGLMIGKIDTFWLQDGSNYYNIKVKLTNDLAKVKSVYVVENLMKIEQEKLEEEVIDGQ